MRYIKIPADMNLGMVLVDTNVPAMGEGQLRYFQEEVGGWVEQVRLGQTLKRNDVVMLVDEESVLKDKPRNSRASALYGIFQHGGQIAGDALLVGLHTAYTEDGPEEGWWSLPGDIDLEMINKYIRDLMPKVG